MLKRRSVIDVLDAGSVPGSWMGIIYLALFFEAAAAFLAAWLLFMASEIFFRAAALILRRGLSAGADDCRCRSSGGVLESCRCPLV